MTPAQIDFLRDFAVDNLPRAQADREQINRYGGNLYDRLAHSSVAVRGRQGATATEHAAASVLESVCLLRRQPPLFPKQRTDTLHHLTSAAHALCLHTGKTVSWLAEAAQPEPEQQEPPPAPARPMPPIAGRWLSTEEAAKWLGVQPQTMRSWSSKQTGPIQPTKMGRALRWSGDAILAVLKAPARNCQ